MAETNSYFLNQNKFDQIQFLQITNIYTSKYFTIISPVIGAPVITLIIEPLLKLKPKNIYLSSICGGIQTSNNKLEIGDIVFPTGAICDEGTSPHYNAKEEIKYFWKDKQQKLVNNTKLRTDITTHTGKLWTTDAIYKETNERVQEYASKGAIGVDMEFSALLHLCNIYSIALASIFVCSDLVGLSYNAKLSAQRVKKNLKLSSKLLLQTILDKDIVAFALK